MTECDLLCRIVPKAQYAMTEGLCSIQPGVWGCCKPHSRSRAERWPLEALKNLYQKEAVENVHCFPHHCHKYRVDLSNESYVQTCAPQIAELHSKLGEVS